MCVLKELLINCIIVTIFMQFVSEAESCVNCGPFGIPSGTLPKYVRNLDRYNRGNRVARKHRQPKKEAIWRLFQTRRSSRNVNSNIPPVVHPPWDSNIPKFNAVIVRRMGNQETPLCSGALISNSFIVTVGTGCVLMHSNRAYSPDDLIVRLVSFEPDINEILTHEIMVTKVLVHEGCCKPGSYLGHNDIALLQLTEEVVFDDYIRPAKITRRSVLNHPAVNEHWDLTNFRIYHLPIDFSDAVWFVRTSFISTNICDSIIPTRIYHKLKMTCASYYHEGSEDCSTDQGSPLSYKGELIGLLLYRQYCGGPSSAGLFVNIGVQSKWIRKNVQQMSNGQEAV